MLDAREDVSSLELCRGLRQDTLSQLGHAEQLTTITQVRRGGRIEKQSPAVFIFGSIVLCLEAE